MFLSKRYNNISFFNLKWYNLNGEYMKKIKIILGILIILIIVSISSYIYDKNRYDNNKEPKLCISVINQDGSKVTYYGLGYKIIRYVKISPNEPFQNSKDTKMGSWFMKYTPTYSKNINSIESFYNTEVTKDYNINNLPQNYTISEAQKDSYLILRNEIYNKNQYDNFINDYKNQKESFLRIIETTTEGDLLIYDLLYKNNMIYLVIDYSRDKYASKEESKLTLQTYKYLSNYNYKNKTYLVLNNEEIKDNNFKNGMVFTISK